MTRQTFRRYAFYCAVGCAILFLLYTNTSAKITESLLSFVRIPDPSAGNTWQPSQFVQQLAGAAILLLFGFLVYDRWKEFRDEFRDLRKDADAKLNEAADHIRGHLKQQIDDKVRKVDALQSQTASLLQDYPWLIGLKEADFIPNVASMKLVQIVAKGFLDKGEVSLAYEYLYSWLDGDKPLRGTLEDLYDLVVFCETGLHDEYLANAFINQRVSNLQTDFAFCPTFCREPCERERLFKLRGLPRNLN